MPVRFKFCGDDTVPDWVLSVINDLSHMESNELIHLVQTVIESILKIDDITKNDMKSVLPKDLVNCKTHVAALMFIIRSATAYDVSESTLSNELQQVGFPHEHAISLCKLYTENCSKLKLKSQSQSLRYSVPKDIKCYETDDEDVILNLEAWQAESNGQENYEFRLTNEQAKLMLHELTDVYQRMENLM